MTEDYEDFYPVLFVRELPQHPVYDRRNIRAIFRPCDNDMDDNIRQMVGHEFIWKFVGFFGEEPLWMPSDPEDIDAYYEIRDRKRPKWDALWILESDLDIIQVEKLDA